MALIVNVVQGAEAAYLGDFDSLVLSETGLHTPSVSEPLATHVHHRWLVHDQGHTYTELKITGPLWVDGPQEQHLGPYLTLSMLNGVLYVDQRIFGFFDAGHDDWYITDLGQHWKSLRMRFQKGP